LYTNQNIRVQWGGALSEACPVSNGVKQGGVLSPVLFLVYIDELLLSLKKSGHGCFIGSTFCGALGYADDVVLLAPSFSSLKCMLDVCERFANDYNVLFNSSKSKLIICNSKYVNSCINVPPLNFMGGIIEAVTADVHLGNIIGSVSHADRVNSAVNDFVARFNMVLSHFQFAPFYVKYKLFKTFCMPLYGSQLWDYTSTSIQRFYVTWRKCIRKLFNLPYTTHCHLLPAICDDIPVENQLYNRCINFISHLATSNNKLCQLSYQLALCGSRSTLCNNINIISRHYNVSKYKISTFVPPKTSLISPSAGFIRDLLFLKCSYADEHIHKDDLVFLINFLCTV